MDDIDRNLADVNKRIKKAGDVEEFRFNLLNKLVTGARAHADRNHAATKESFKVRDRLIQNLRDGFSYHNDELPALTKRIDALEGCGASTKDFAAALHRIEKLEREFVRLSGTVSKYMSRREAADNTLMAQIKSVAYDLREIQERLAAVELGAFPEVSGSIAKVIGRSKGGRDNPLDRKPRSRR